VTTEYREVILPSGAFAKVRSLTGRDYLMMKEPIGDKDLMFVMITRAVVIDDAPITYEQLLDMDMRDVSALGTEMAKYVSGPVRINPISKPEKPS